MRMTGAVETYLARRPKQGPLAEQDAGLEQACLRVGIAYAGRDDRQSRKRCPLVYLVGAYETIAGRQPIHQRLRVQPDEAEAGLRQCRQIGPHVLDFAERKAEAECMHVTHCFPCGGRQAIYSPLRKHQHELRRNSRALFVDAGEGFEERAAG